MKKIIRSLLCLLLALAVIFPALPASAAAYSDTGGHWAEREIEKWSSMGIIEGSGGRFRPNDSITRAEMAAIMDRVMGYRVKSSNTFSDLPQTWYTDAVLRANASGVILGDGGKMRPESKITRQEASTLICRALNIDPGSGYTSFSDDSSIAGWAKPHVSALSQKGLISGVGNNNFNPNGNMTRAAVVKLLDNAIATLITDSGIYSNPNSGTIVINTGNVQLSGTYISGDLIIAEGVGEGSATLENVTVSGSTTVKGGSSVSISGSRVPNLTVNKLGGSPTVRVSGSTVVSNTRILDSCKLEETRNMTGSGFEAVTVDEGGKEYLRADLDGKFTSLRQNAYNADIRVSGDISDIQVNAVTSFQGDFTFDSIYVNPSVGCTINGVPVSSATGSGLHGLAISIPGSLGYARVGDVLTASTVTMGSVSVSYQWYWYDRDIITSDSRWNKISGATSKTYTVPSSMSGRYLMVEATSGGTTLRAMLPSAVGSGSTAGNAITIENYTSTNSTKNEATVKFVFAKPLAFKNSSGTITPVENNYDFKYSGSSWFSVKVNSLAPSTDDSLIASAIYTTGDQALTVTLAGDAASVSSRVELRINANLYDTSGNTLRASSAPVAVRLANVSSWQNGGTNGNTGLDTTPPKASAGQTGNGSSVLRIAFDEPLGYRINGVTRPVNDGYDLMNIAGSAGLFSIKLDGMPDNGTQYVTSAIYNASGMSVTVTLKSVLPDESVTLAPLQPFYDIFGNELRPTDAGVFYRRSDEIVWYRAPNQAVADAAARGEELEGYPDILPGISARYGQTLTAGMGTLSIQTGITFSWYRSDNKDYDANDTLLATGKSYTPVQADIDKYIILIARSDSLPGNRPQATLEVARAETTVKAGSVTENTVSGGSYDLTRISNLFTINSNGDRTYKLAEDYGPNVNITNGKILTAPAGTYRIVVNVDQSNTHEKHSSFDSDGKPVPGAPVSTLTLSSSIVRNIQVSTRPLDLSKSYSNSDAGKVWMTARLEDEGHKLYVKDVTTTDSVGESLVPGNYFYSSGYSPLMDSGSAAEAGGPSQNYHIEGYVHLGGSVSNAKAGKYHLVETDGSNNVVRTGVVTVSADQILAVVRITNNYSAAGYSVKYSGYGTASNRITPVSGPTIIDYEDVYVPLNTSHVQFTRIPAGGGTDKSITSPVSFTNCQTYVTIAYNAFG